MMKLPPDFKDFLRLLTSKGVKYLLIGGYAVAYHGYPRATADIDIWVGVDEENAEKICEAVQEFGFCQATKELFLRPGRIVRMGNPPLRIELFTGAVGVDFASCYASRITFDWDGLEVNVINLEDLKSNKRASGRHKDLSDLENLP